MALQARYNPQEDRMQLTLHPADGVPRAFWITRRQWLGLFHAVAALPQSVTPETGASAPVQLKKSGRVADAPLLVPVAVQGIKLRRQAQGVKLIFAVDGDGVALTVQSDGLARLKQMLLQQAEHADWDAAAALARLDAQGMARAAMKKASRPSEGH